MDETTSLVRIECFAPTRRSFARLDLNVPPTFNLFVTGGRNPARFTGCGSLEGGIEASKLVRSESSPATATDLTDLLRRSPMFFLMRLAVSCTWFADAVHPRQCCPAPPGCVLRHVEHSHGHLG